MHESSHQQLAGLQKEATSSLPAIRPAKGCCRKAANLLLLLQDTRQTHSRPAIRRGVCWTLCRSLLAERRGLELLFSELPDPTERSYLQPRCTSPPARCHPAEEPWPQHPDKEHPRYAGCEVQSCSTSSASAEEPGEQRRCSPLSLPPALLRQPSDPPLASCPRELPPAELFVLTDLPDRLLAAFSRTDGSQVTRNNTRPRASSQQHQR